jgi:hypothetical protein
VFKIDIIGVDTWRWSIRADEKARLTLVGQVRGTREQAEVNSWSQITSLLAIAKARDASVSA